MATEKLELEIYNLIKTYERDYGLAFESIRSKKDGGLLSGIVVNFDDQRDIITVISTGSEMSEHAKKCLLDQSVEIDAAKGLWMKPGEVLGVQIFNLIENYVYDHDDRNEDLKLFKSIRSKKDKFGILTNISVSLEEND